jgi:hypothetical protein
VGPPIKNQGSSRLTSLQALGYNRIMKTYTLKEIIDAWENNYGGDMKKDYPRFFKELIKNVKKRS